jgi:lysophospholipase L1-like esterase
MTLPLGKRVAFSLGLVLLLLVGLEIGTRLLYALRDPLLALVGRPPREMFLDPYEMPDPRYPGHWVMRPGFSMTLREVVDAKRQADKFVGVNDLEETARRHGIGPDDVVFRINRDGFKGPELDATRSRPRILAIGDSCTAGTQLDAFTYSRSLERELAARGVAAEVVNGGVEGYKPDDVVVRLEDFEALHPDWTIVYIGWNALFDGWEGRTVLGRNLATVRLVQRIGLALAPKRALRDEALDAFTKPKRPVRDAPEVRARDDYVPTFLPDVEHIVEAMQAGGSRVAIATLPGLYVTDEAPTPEALALGHLPSYTNNPYELAKMTERYDTLLRELAERHGLLLIDLERWADEALAPRHDWFVDSVHPTAEGQARIGAFMAQVLAPELGKP